MSVPTITVPRRHANRAVVILEAEERRILEIIERRGWSATWQQALGTTRAALAAFNAATPGFDPVAEAAQRAGFRKVAAS